MGASAPHTSHSTNRETFLMKLTVDLNDAQDCAAALLLLQTGAPAAAAAAPAPVAQQAAPVAQQAAPVAQQAAPAPAAPVYDQAAHAQRVLQMCLAKKDTAGPALGPLMQAMGISAITEGNQEQLLQLEAALAALGA